MKGISVSKYILKDEPRRKRESRDGYRKGVHKYRSKRIDYDEHEDPEIQAEIDRGELVKILK